MFCTLGLVADVRPVAAPVWLKVGWIRPVRSLTRGGSASMYVLISFESLRHARISAGSSWSAASCSSTLSAVE